MHTEPLCRRFFFAGDQWVLRIIAIVLATYIFEGPIRFTLVQLHAEMALYFRDAVMAAIVLSALVSQPLRTVRPTLFVLLLILACHIIVGMLTLASPSQALIGAKVFLPLLFGAAIAPLVRDHSAQTLRFARWTLFVTVIGVLVNRYVEFPWVGMSYSTAAGSVELARSWTVQGAQRLPGFTRASYVAAGIIILSLYPALLATRTTLAKGLLLCISAVTIGVTTSKGPYVGLLILGCLEALWHAGKVRLWGFGLLVLSTACLALPLLTAQLNVASRDIPAWQTSFFERMQEMWPRSLDLLSDPFQLLWGRGIGGIGLAQRFSEPISLSADNVMLYLFVTFGALGIIYVAILLGAAIRYVGTTHYTTNAGLTRAWLSIWFGVGLTANMIEDTSTELVIGLIVGWIFTAQDEVVPHFTRSSSARSFWAPQLALSASGWGGRYG